MKYSRYQRGLHVEKVATILRDDPTLSGRAMFRILNEEGHHLCRSYVNQIVADAFLRIGEEERLKSSGMRRHAEWIKEVMVLSGELDVIKRKLDSLVWSYPEDLEPRY